MAGMFRMTSEQHEAWKARQARAYADQRLKADAPPANGTIEARVASRAPIQQQASNNAVAHLVEPVSKYHNKRTDGYASKREAKRAAELATLQAAGAISDLREQVPFLLVPKAIDETGKVIERAATYVADFVYTEHGQITCEDCKGVRTDLYILKRKLMLMIHNIRIKET